MDFMTPPMFDILNIQTWKAKMSMYLKALGIHVYLATIKDSYCLNGKHLEAVGHLEGEGVNRWLANLMMNNAELKTI